MPPSAHSLSSTDSPILKLMPQAPRKDPSSQRVQDKESKRARGALSCAECRRLKLKCDKTVPCSSCKRRGCSAICPNGSLITGQGTRFVLADTEKLHQKIGQMSDRIRQLEDALAILQSTMSTDPHPLLHRELLKVKSSIELHAAVDGEERNNLDQEDSEESQLDAFGTLAIRDDGAATFYGRSAGSESLLMGEAASPTPDNAVPPTGGEWHPDLPSSVRSRSVGFPLSTTSPCHSSQDLIAALPSYQQAWHLCELYLEQAPWFFGAVKRKQLHEEILPMWYSDAPKSPCAPSPQLQASMTDSPGQGKSSLHELALLFVIFCFGALTDMALPAAPDNPDAERYYQLTKAALMVEPPLERPPSLATVQALSLMAIYEGLCSGDNSIESTWTLMGLATKLAQSIGLHRDCARWGLSPAEVQKRRALFWELFITDCWQSLATGRLATFSLPFVDCELPFDYEEIITEDGSRQPSFPYWKARFGAECVSAVVQGTLTSRAPKYSIILELDRKVRDMELPLYAQGPPPQGVGLSQTMSHFMPTNYRELTLLYIHRCFFAHAISSNPMDPIKSQYAPSFLAGYRSACTIVGSVKEQFTMFPKQIARFWVLWTHAFSASVMLASVVTHSSQSKVAPAALLELKTACDLFEQAAGYGGRAVKFLPIMKRLQNKAQQVFRDTNNGIPPSVPNDIFKPSKTEDTNDELSIFSGKTHTLSTKSAPPASSRGGNVKSSPHASTSNGPNSAVSRASTDSPQQSFDDNPSFAGVHPSLIDELHGFDGQIKAQIQNAYRANSDVFGQMMADSSRQAQAQQQTQRYQQQMELERKEAERREMSRQQMHLQQQIQEEQRQHQLETQHQMQQQHIRRHPYEHDPGYVQSQPVIPPGNNPLNHLQHRHGISQVLPPAVHSQTYEYPRGSHQPPPQHQMYTIPPEFQTHPSSSSVSASSSQSQMPPPPSYDVHMQPPLPPPSAQRPGYPPPPPPPAETYQYWPAAPVPFNVPSLQQHPHGPPSYAQQPLPQGYQPQHYTPDAALRGIAADDPRLQETWQSYMYKVGSPRHLLDD